MNTLTTNNFIGVYDNILSQHESEHCIEYFENLKQQGHTYFKNIKKHQGEMEEAFLSWNFKVSQFETSNIFMSGLERALEQYFNAYSILADSNFAFYDIKIKKILPCGGYHTWHYENQSILTSNRYLVVQAYLNTVQEGGETEFLYLNQRIKAVQGRYIIFPSSFTHTHRGNQPINEHKYIATTWGLIQN